MPHQQQHSFEELLLEITAQLIHIPALSVDNAIMHAQRRICEAMNFDHSALWQLSDKDNSLITITHHFSPSDGPVLPNEPIDATVAFPWLLQKALDGQDLVFNTEELPPEASVDRDSCQFYGVKSVIMIPFKRRDGEFLGIMSWDTLYENRTWSNRDVQRLKLVTDIFSSALERKKHELTIIENEKRLALAAESADAGLWEFDCSSQTYWITNRIQQLFGFGERTTVSQDHVIASVHPEDRKIFSQTMAHSFATGKQASLEYRVEPVQGTIRWLSCKGQPFYYDDGTPSRMLGACVDITDQKLLEEKQNKDIAEITSLKKQLEQQNYYLREDLLREHGGLKIIGQSRAIKAVLNSAAQVAPTPATVLLLGETGTGKGVIANTIHMMSDRSDKPLITVNCSALPENLIESELFGREKGAFTGADKRQIGRFELADKGTLFLDEIGEMSLAMQTKLLRILQEGEFERLGSSKTNRVDVRIIAATVRNLYDDVKNGLFREDLFYRLNVFPITIPPLRQRKEDIPLLVQFFIEKYSKKMQKSIHSIPNGTLDQMMQHRWPGNVRELEHEVERSVILTKGSTLTLSNQCFCMSFTPSPADLSLRDLQSVERDHIQQVLKECNWKIEGKDGAAAILDIHPSTLRFRLKKLKITRPS